MKKIKIHKKKCTETVSNYFFIKSDGRCVGVTYDSESDIYGDESPDRYIRVLIHNEALFNMCDCPDMEEITIDEVPQAIVDLLTFLND